MSTKAERNLETLAEKAADQAIRRMKVTEPEEESFSHLAQLDTDDGIDHESEGEKVMNFDIFDYCDDLVQSGKHQIKYEIKKNGEMLTHRHHPYSWEALQKEHKGGHYTVSAKSMTTKRFVKHETRSLADPASSQKLDDLETARPVIQQQAPQGPSFTELFTLLNTTRESERENAREQSRDSANANNASTLALVEMMKTTSAQSQTMMMEIAKMTAAMTEKLSDQQQKLVERMDAKFEKLVEKFSQAPQEKGMTALEIMALQSAAQEKGFAMFEKMARLAEAKTEERLAMIEDARDERDDRKDRGKKSLTDSLIESVLPTVASALAGQMGQQAKPQQQIRPQARGSLPRSQNSQRTPQALESRPRTPASANETATPKIVKGSEEKSVNGRRNSGTGSSVSPLKSNLGLPTANFGEVKTETVTKQGIEQILTPVFVTCLGEQKDPTLVAVELQAALTANGIDKPTFLRTISKEDMMTIVKGYHLPAEANPWFEEVYANLQGTTGVDARIEHPAS
jgi:hypothetical protein